MLVRRHQCFGLLLRPGSNQAGQAASCDQPKGLMQWSLLVKASLNAEKGALEGDDNQRSGCLFGDMGKERFFMIFPNVIMCCFEAIRFSKSDRLHFLHDYAHMAQFGRSLERIEM